MSGQTATALDQWHKTINAMKILDSLMETGTLRTMTIQGMVAHLPRWSKSHKFARARIAGIRCHQATPSTTPTTVSAVLGREEQIR